jgi:hypothetical protein
VAGTLADCAHLKLSVDVLYADVWTAPPTAPSAPITLQYSALSTPAPLSATSSNCETTWKATCRIVIHYPTHIAPLWTLSRQVLDQNGALIADHTCVTCHSPKDAQGKAQIPAASLDLTSTASSVQPDWFTSFQELLFPRFQCSLTMGILSCASTVTVTDPMTGKTTQVPNTSLAAPMSGGSAKASAAFFAPFTTPSNTTHYQTLSAAELRLVAEWLDIGAQYYNDPFAIPVAN